MKIAGIIAEYNPFHNGHRYHIEETRRRTGCDAVVVVMSGDFLQRGIPAMTDRFLRAEAALRCGADIVLELPMYGATASAEDFASAGVRALSGLSCDYISYGAESAEERDALATHERDAFATFPAEPDGKNPDAKNSDGETCSGGAGIFRKAAEFLLSEPPEFKQLLLSHVREGNSYAKSRALALAEFAPESAKLLEQPNNILAVEYEKAILATHASLRSCAVKRSDLGYHDTSVAAFCSASAIRGAVADTGAIPAEAVPAETVSLYSYLTADSIVTADDFSDMLCAELSAHTPETLSRIYDLPGDLANRILEQASRPFTWTSLAESVKCKAFTRSRIDRALCHTLLHITTADADVFKNAETLPYLRVLGMRSDSSPLLSELQRTSGIPLIVRLSDDVRALSRESRRLLAAELRASELYAQIYFRRTGLVREDVRRRLLTV
ncbi:MAG: nucleotidyltransferase family protein [Lachnospiraceae bacterium]|nr:nucleotidyltransferase family protein [Lachnospiraceae bacterium]